MRTSLVPARRDHRDPELELVSHPPALPPGDEIVVVIKRARPISSAPSAAPSSSGQTPKVRRGDVRRAVVVRTKYPTRRADGRYVRFDDNAAVLVNLKHEMIGNRIGGVVAAELRSRGWGKSESLFCLGCEARRLYPNRHASNTRSRRETFSMISGGTRLQWCEGGPPDHELTRAFSFHSREPGSEGRVIAT